MPALPATGASDALTEVDEMMDKAQLVMAPLQYLTRLNGRDLDQVITTLQSVKSRCEASDQSVAESREFLHKAKAKSHQTVAPYLRQQTVRDGSCLVLPHWQ